MDIFKFLRSVLSLLVICTGFFLVSCARQAIPIEPGINNEDVMRVVLEFANDLKHDKHLHLEDSRVFYGNYGNYIDKIRLKFITQNILEMCEAREFLVDVAEGYLDRLNEDPVLGPLIAAYPIGPENLEIYICFESYHIRYVDKRYIVWTVLEDGMAYYYAGDLINEFNIWDRDAECWHHREEPYYKSVQIVNINREAERMYQERHPKPGSLFAGDRILLDDKNGQRPIVRTGL